MKLLFRVSSEIWNIENYHVIIKIFLNFANTYTLFIVHTFFILEFILLDQISQKLWIFN